MCVFMYVYITKKKILLFLVLNGERLRVWLCRGKVAYHMEVLRWKKKKNEEGREKGKEEERRETEGRKGRRGANSFRLRILNNYLKCLPRK